MKLTYQTAVASLIQFLSMTILGVPNALVSIISTCQHDRSNCVSNSIVSIIYFLLLAAWFGIILFLGYNAQKRRSRKLAVVLAGCEFATLVTAGYINLPRDTNILDKGTSLLDALLSVLIIYLAIRLFIAGGKRIVTPTRRVRNRKPEQL